MNGVDTKSPGPGPAGGDRPPVRISVIMACYNAAPYLAEAIGSLQRQTFGAWELVLVDDASRDESLRLARDRAAVDPRIRVFSLPRNSGAATARNTAIAHAAGEWLAILDADDVALPTRLAVQLRVGEADPAIGLVASFSREIGPDGTPLMSPRYACDHEGLLRGLRQGRFPPHSSVLYRASVVRALGGFNRRFEPSEDADFCLRLAELHRMVALPEPLVHIRKHPGSISNAAGGRLQLRVGMAAVICHKLRMAGAPDPSQGTDTGWAAFVQWLDARLLATRHYEQREAWLRARARYVAAPNRLAGLLRFATDLARSGHAGALVAQKIAGSRFATRAAAAWAGGTPPS